MANVKYTPDQWARAREYFEAGLSLADIELKTTIPPPAISKKSKAEFWPKGNEKKQAIEDAARVMALKSNLNETALAIHNELVSERTKQITFFSKAAMKNAALAVNKLGERTTQADHRLCAETIKLSRETVLGKSPDTAIQVNTNTNISNNNGATVDVQDLSDDELLAIASNGRARADNSTEGTDQPS